VAPAGNPLRPTDTESANPFRLAIETVKLQLEVPGPAVIAVAERLMLKSCETVTVKGRLAMCVKTPDEPPTVKVYLPGCTVAGTDIVTVLVLPAAALNGAEGDVVAPLGNPESVMVTGLANPFWPTTETVNVEVELSGSAVMVAGDSVMPKSLGGGGGEDAGDAPHPPRLASHKKMQAPPKALRSVIDGARITHLQVCTLRSGELRLRGLFANHNI
jgi:hypothetical protein